MIDRLNWTEVGCGEVTTRNQQCLFVRIKGTRKSLRTARTIETSKVVKMKRSIEWKTEAKQQSNGERIEVAGEVELRGLSRAKAKK